MNYLLALQQKCIQNVPEGSDKNVCREYMIQEHQNMPSIIQ